MKSRLRHGENARQRQLDRVAKVLAGKTIEKMLLDTTNEEGVFMHSPTIFLEDGSFIRFVVEEHPDGGEYGIEPVLVNEPMNRTNKLQKGDCSECASTGIVVVGGIIEACKRCDRLESNTGAISALRNLLARHGAHGNRSMCVEAPPTFDVPADAGMGIAGRHTARSIAAALNALPGSTGNHVPLPGGHGIVVFAKKRAR